MKEFIIALSLLLISSLAYADALDTSTRANILAGNVAAAADVKTAFDNIQTWSTTLSDVNIRSGAAIDPTKILGTAATLGGTQTFTGAKTFNLATIFNGDVTLGDAAADVLTANGTWAGATPLVFEGATADDFELMFAVVDPTADRTVTFPDADINFTNFSDISVKGWINFNGTGTIATRDSFNVSGIVDNGVGLYTITWDTNFANTNYAVVCNAHDTFNGSSSDPNMVSPFTFAVGSTGLATADDSNTPKDTATVCCIAIGDQ